MAQSSVAIKRENNYDPNLPSKRSTYTDPTDHTPTKEVKREWSPVRSPPTILVCPINVVQGDSILVKLTYKEGPGAFWFIYDLQILNLLVSNSLWGHITSVPLKFLPLDLAKCSAQPIQTRTLEDLD